MINLDETLLAELRFTRSDLEGLTEEEQKDKLRKRFWRFALRYHPDKGGTAEQFSELNEAYNAIILNTEGDYAPEINNYFASIPIDIPDTAFDLLVEEAILSTYQELLHSFYQLPNTEKKREFAQHHASFINLAQTLEEKQTYLNEKRGSYFIKQVNESFRLQYQREWRKFILALFGEEYLDDFQYRHALATGELSPILAWRKLLSPVKVTVALVNSLILAIRLLSSYLFLNKVLHPLRNEFARHYQDFRESRVNKCAVMLWALKILGVLALIAVPLIFFPTTTTILWSLPLIGNFLEVIACPINKMIRPLAQYTSLSPYLVNPALAILLGACAFAFVSFFSLTALINLLLPAAIALSLYTLYGFGKLIKKLYDISPQLALFQLIFGITLSIILAAATYFFPGLSTTAASSTLSLTDFFSCLIGAIFIYQANESIDHMKEEVANVVETLPLPTEEVPEIIKKTVLQEVKTGHYSSRFFNTPKEALYITQKDRTFWQQTASFFGGGEKIPPAREIQKENFIPVPLLLEGLSPS